MAKGKQSQRNEIRFLKNIDSIINHWRYQLHIKYSVHRNSQQSISKAYPLMIL